MITLGPSTDLRIEATAGVIVIFDGALKLVGSNPSAYSKLSTATGFAATGIGTKDIILATDATHEAFVKAFKVINYAALGAAAVFALYRDGTTNIFRASIDFNVPIGCQYIEDDAGIRIVSEKGAIIPA